MICTTKSGLRFDGAYFILKGDGKLRAVVRLELLGL